MSLGINTFSSSPKIFVHTHMQRTNNSSGTQNNGPVDPSTIPENWAFPSYPIRPTTPPIQYMSGKSPRHPPPHPCTFDAIKWECHSVKPGTEEHKGFCVIFHATRCANFDPRQRSPYDCCTTPTIMIVEERKGFCYGPYCPGYRVLEGRCRTDQNLAYRFDRWFYCGEMPEELFPGLLKEGSEIWGRWKVEKSE